MRNSAAPIRFGRHQINPISLIRIFICFLGFFLVGCQTSPKTFYPLGIYTPASTNDFLQIRSAGFNLVTGPAEQDFLNSADLAGLRVMASVGSLPGSSFSKSGTKNRVRRFDSHPALWAWYVVDEPDLNEISPSDVERANRCVKRFASKPTALVLCSGSDALHYAGIPDIVMIDRYPVPWLPLSNFSQNVRLTKFATGSRKKLIAVIQAFDWSYYPELMPARSSFRAPTGEELRCMAYCALAEGANGLFFYCYDDKKWRMPDHPETWNHLREIVSEINERLPLFTAQSCWSESHALYDDREAGWNESLQSSITTTLLEVKKGAGNNAVKPGKYLLAVNTTARDLKFRIKIPTTQPSIVAFQEDRILWLANGFMRDEIQPYAVHVYGPL